MRILEPSLIASNKLDVFLFLSLQLLIIIYDLLIIFALLSFFRMIYKLIWFIWAKPPSASGFYMPILYFIVIIVLNSMTLGVTTLLEWTIYVSIRRIGSKPEA